jgi:uncharacterized protein DUF6798
MLSMREMSEPSADQGENRQSHILFLGIAGAYLNSVVFGFSFGASNHEFDLPLVNWLRDPTLYPQDPIREAFARFPTIFWDIVAYLSRSFSPERVVFIFFLLTKLLFFLALARIVGARVKDNRLTACIVFSVALSPFLNDQTPLGASIVLDAVQTQTTLAVALLLWVGCLLLEEHWIAAALLCALTVYLDALYFVFMIFAFAAFAVFDWRRHKAAILVASLLGAVISLPWLFLFRGVAYREYPDGYVEALLAFYPFHLNLRSHEAYELMSGAGLVIAAVLLGVVARKASNDRDVRLEVLTASFLVPVIVGAIIGEIHLTPLLARLQLLRADTFLLLYSILLVQIYGANLLRSAARGPATNFFLGVTAILLPVSEEVGLLWLVFVGMALWADPGERLERFLGWLAPRLFIRAIALGLLLAGVVAAWKQHAEWSFMAAIALAILAACFFASNKRDGELGGITVLLCGLALLFLLISRVTAIPRLWNPKIAPTALESNWRGVQEWSRAHTPPDALFLVPTYPGGFREFSQRSSWGEWKDGQAMYHYPPFEQEYRKRMMAVGYSWGNWNGTAAITETYKHLSWGQLLEVARQNHLGYILQFRDVVYPAPPIFANQDYAVYKVEY